MNIQPHLLFGKGSTPYLRRVILANFLNLPKSIMKNLKHFKLGLALVAMILGLQGTATAQWGDWGGGGEEATPTDTTSKDSSAGTEDGGAWGGAWGGGEETQGPQMPERKPYVRFIPPFDSLREIIYYEGIIEDENCDYCGADSLYWRAKKYMMQRFGKDNIKKFVVEDKKADRITLKVTIPMVTKYGQYKSESAGILEYKVTLRFKDGRYKYQFGNFVHIQTPNGLGKESTRTYHEYYMKVKKGYQVTDKFLLAADREVKEFVDGLKKSLREPYQPDEDDW